MSDQLDEFVPESLRGMRPKRHVPPVIKKPLSHEEILLWSLGAFLLFVIVATFIGALNRSNEQFSELGKAAATGKTDPDFVAPEPEPTGFEYETFEERYCDGIYGDLFYEIDGFRVHTPGSLIRTMGIRGFEYDGKVAGELIFKRQRKRYQQPIRRELVLRKKPDVPMY